MAGTGNRDRPAVIPSGLLKNDPVRICRDGTGRAYLGTELPGNYSLKKTQLEMAATVEGYCVKCKAKRNMKDANQVTMANGRKAMKGKCPECGTGMFKILGK